MRLNRAARIAAFAHSLVRFVTAAAAARAARRVVAFCAHTYDLTSINHLSLSCRTMRRVPCELNVGSVGIDISTLFYVYSRYL